MTDRSIQPAVNTIDHIDFIKPHIYDVTTHVKLLWMKDVPNETVRLDLYFDAGIIRGKNNLPSIVHSLLFSGTSGKSSSRIHEEIDSLGGFLDTDISIEGAVITVYCLREHLQAIAKIVSDAVEGLVFHETEVDDTLKSMKQRFNENKLKVKTVAQQKFRGALFASDECYSTLARESDFDSVDYSQMKRFHREHYLNGLTRMTLVGNVEQDDADALIDRFGKWAIDKKPEYTYHFDKNPAAIHADVEGTVQTAIRIGRILFPKTHPDFIEFQILNTILGDYFGSRLMSNIREDKGYTYGIGSASLEMHESGYFVIVTEVGSEFRDATLKEIRYEMERLQTEPVGDEELELVKNYTLGQMLKGADGPHAMLDMFNVVDIYGLDLSFYDEAIKKVKEITPARLQELAVQYLKWDDYLVVTAG